MTEPRELVRGFLARFLPIDTLADDEDIFATGLVNSLFVMQLVLFVETELDCPVDDDDLEIENFASVDGVVRLVARKAAPATVAAEGEAR